MILPPPGDDDFLDKWEAAAQLEDFMELMEACVRRDDAEIVRLLVLQAFEQDRDAAVATFPMDPFEFIGLDGRWKEGWNIITPQEQERIYL